MVCDDCFPKGFEIKCLGGVGACCICGRETNLGGPITAAQRDGLRAIIKTAYERGRTVGFAEGMVRK